MRIDKFTVENLESGCVTDNANPRFSFALSSQNKGVRLEKAVLKLGDWSHETTEQILVPYTGERLKPFTSYEASVTACDNYGETDSASVHFETGRMNTPWQAEWITDGAYSFTEKRVSPVPMVFRKKFSFKKPVSRVVVYATAMGVYRLDVNGVKAGDRYFAPGFTSYKHTLQYQTYDVTALAEGNTEFMFTVAGGWAVGSFVFTRANRVSADRQALLAEIRVKYADGTEEVFGTGTDWQVSEGGNWLEADLYDGEVYDASADINNNVWRSATIERLKINPEIIAETGSPVRAHEVFSPISCTKRADGELIYDFGQNFAGVIRAEIDGKAGQKILFRHAEVLNADGSPATALLRSAKARAEYICKDGRQSYSPEFTYMGFRYVGVKGADEENLKLSAVALYSDVESCGSFSCSDERINKLQSNIVWGAKSNFVEIPTDCPQRDERMGWTGDIAVFAPTACFNFNISRFIGKWLKDVRSEQHKTGGIPNTVPVQGYGFPTTMPVMAVDFWGDACAMVPWAEYMARGDKRLPEKMYPVMKKYVKACKFWAGFGFGKHRYIWHTPHLLHFGDWVAPDVNKMSEWQKRSKWTATASLCHTSQLTALVAEILGRADEAKYYNNLAAKVADAYVSVFTDGNGKLKKEFQTAYVLPLAFGMFPEDVREKAAKNLAALVKSNDYCIATGFPGTPFILFALADNGCEDEAFKMLMNDKCPSWLYEVKAGGTTVWERWDALKEDGTLNSGEEDGTGGMISFNHYASGAVGDFLYKRVAGIIPEEGGYKKFTVKPLVGGGLTHARGETICPYGKIVSEWRVENGVFTLNVTVPVSAECTVVMPDGTTFATASGDYTYSCRL